MAGNRNSIKGITVEIGGDTTSLGKALEGINKKSDDLSKELGEINRQLKFDPKNTELLAQKQKVLADAVSTTEDKLEKLKEAEKQVQKQFERGEVSEEQVRALKREIIAAEGKMKDFAKAAKEAADAVDGVGKKSEDTSGKVAAFISNGLTGLATGFTTATTAALATAESTREYRTDMVKLETAYTNVGHSQEAAIKTYKELQSILGDSGQAVEAANHLAQLANNEKDLTKWTNIATGVYATFGNSLPIENLTEAANETAKTGAITGGLADALNWADTEGMNFGVTLKENIDFTELSAKQLKSLTDEQRAEYEARKAQYEEIEKYNQSVVDAVSAEDKFQIALDNCTTEQERQALITSTLNNLYGDASAQYKETNADIIAANEANEKLNAALADLGAYMEPILTKIKEIGAELLTNAVPIIETLKANLPMVAVAIGGITAALVAFKIAAIASTAATQGMTLAQFAASKAQTVLNAVMNANPIGLIILGITALVTAVMWMIENWEGFSEFFVDLWAGITDALNSAVTWISDGFTKLSAWASEKFEEIGAAISGFVSYLAELPGKIWTAIVDGITVLGNWGKEMISKAKTAMSDLVTEAINKLKELPKKVLSVGKDLVTGLWEGIKSKINWMKDKLKSFADGVVNSVKDFFGIHSPSTETAYIGKMLDEGLVVGIKKHKDDPIRAIENVSKEMLAATSDGGDITLERKVSQSFGSAASSSSSSLSSSSDIMPKLDKIYRAILNGHIIMLDGKTLVGSTADRYDNELGQRRVLAERGAL